ncbi:MAG: EAL domain-containing protein [Tissierella sp.]|uniref:EAL domain-containing protein n=1 Tax=Tissierella sp. TaxID=41274 RepID=UPI003F9C22B4
MACERCSRTPSFSRGRCRIYMNVEISELRNKLKKLISTSWNILKSTCTHFEFEVNDFETFLLKLHSFNFISLKEASGIDVLPVYVGEKLSFPIYSRTKKLNKWISLLMSKELIYILENETLVTHFQPIIDIKKASIYGYELLSRGIKSDGNLMPPFEMFNLARESDLLFNLDRQARETSIISSAKEKIDKKLFINFLPTVIYNPEVCLKSTIDLINKFNFEPENITFEVVETEDINDADNLNTILNYYREKGFKIALDDIGSGYSSLNNLSKFYPNYIKVDMDIIRNIHKNELQQEIFKALVALSKKTDIKVLAEGVETKEELDFVVDNGTDLVQGFYFGKPSKKPLKKIEF